MRHQSPAGRAWCAGYCQWQKKPSRIIFLFRMRKPTTRVAIGVVASVYTRSTSKTVLSGTSILAMKSTSMLLRRAGVWRLGPGKALKLTKGTTEKLFSGVYGCHHDFLPLNFVTSCLGMNTYDMNNMSNKQSLFWAIFVPLTCAVMTVILSIAYNGDQLRWLISNGSHVLMRYVKISNVSRISIADLERITNNSI